MASSVIGTKNWTRREAIAAAAGFAMAPAVPAWANTADAAGLHDIVARKAIEAAGDKPDPLRLLLPQGSMANVKPVADAFFQATGIRIDVVEVAVDDINTELYLDALASQHSFDLALPATFGIPDLVEFDAIAPLTDFSRRHEPEGFRSGTLFDVGDTFEGEMYGFQADGDTYLMFYHRDMIQDSTKVARYGDAFGAPLEMARTWKELDRQMAFFHRPDEGVWGGLLFRTPDYLISEWWVRFHAKGVWPMSADLEPQIASEQGVEALEEMIRATGSLHPDTAHLGLFDNWKAFEQGNVFCNIGWGGSQKYLNRPQSRMRDRMLHGMTPGGIVDGELLVTPMFNWGWSYVVTANSSRPELAYLFALFASSPKMSTLSVRQADGFFDPIRAEHYLDDGIRQAYSDSFLQTHKRSLDSSIPGFYLGGHGEYLGILSNLLARALAGDIQPHAALERAAQRWRLITKKHGHARQMRTWNALRSKYPQHIRNRLIDIA